MVQGFLSGLDFFLNREAASPKFLIIRVKHQLVYPLFRHSQTEILLGEFREITEEFLQVNHIRYDKIIFGLPTGERILINDNKPSGLVMGHVFNKERDKTPSLSVRINENL